VRTSACTQSTLTPWSAARLRPLSSPAAEKSTAVTCQPCKASQTALRPAPAARSSARPGARYVSSAITNLFGSAGHASAPLAIRRSQAWLSTFLSAAMPSGAGQAVAGQGRSASGWLGFHGDGAARALGGADAAARAHALGPEARKGLRVLALVEGGDRQQLR